jgi:hypothetical protein
MSAPCWQQGTRRGAGDLHRVRYDLLEAGRHTGEPAWADICRSQLIAATLGHKALSVTLDVLEADRTDCS